MIKLWGGVSLVTGYSEVLGSGDAASAWYFAVIPYE